MVFASFTTTVASYIYYHQYYNIPTSNAELVFIFTCQTMLISKGREFSRCYDIFIRFCITANRLQEFFDTEGVDTSASNTESTLSFEHIEIKNLYFVQKNIKLNLERLLKCINTILNIFYTILCIFFFFVHSFNRGLIFLKLEH